MHKPMFHAPCGAYSHTFAQARFRSNAAKEDPGNMTPVGFEPTQLALVELESTPVTRKTRVQFPAAEFC